MVHLTEARPTTLPTDNGSPSLRLCQSAHPIISTLLLPVFSYDEPSPELTGDCPEAAQHPTGELEPANYLSGPKTSSVMSSPACQSQ